MPRPFQIKGGLAFKAQIFEPLETAPLPDRVAIAVDTRAQLNIKPGDTVLSGQPLHTDADDIVMHHASVSGVVSEVSQSVVTIESDGQDKKFKHKASTPDTFEQLETLCRNMGLVGLGGATYPVHNKLASVKNAAPNGIDTLLINAAECDPAIYCDEAQILANAEEIAKSIMLTWQLSTARHCIVGIEENKSAAIDLLNQYLPGSVKVVSVPAIYPSGAENTLYRLCTGKAGGVRNNHSICFNVSTCHSIYRAVHHAEPLIERVVTVVKGKFLRNIVMRIGTPVTDIAKLIGAHTDHSIIQGGRMMGVALSHDNSVEKSTNSLLFEKTQARKPVPCIRCGACADVCPEDLSPQHLHWHANSVNTSALFDLNLNACIECACCNLVCPSHIELAGQFSQAKKVIVQQTIEQEKAAIAKQRYENRLTRLGNQSAKQRRQLDHKTTTLSQSANTDALKKDLIANALKKSKNKKPSIKNHAPGDNSNGA